MLSRREAGHVHHPVVMDGEEYATVREAHPVQTVRNTAAVGVAPGICENDGRYPVCDDPAQESNMRDTGALTLLRAVDAQRLLG